MTSRFIHASAVMALLLFPGALQADQGAVSPVSSFVMSHCDECHSGKKPSGSLNLSTLATDLRDAEVLRRWVRIHDRVADGEMPPRGHARSPEPARAEFLSALSERLTRADAALRQTILRRLNRIEYEHTVRDLFGIRVEVVDMLPPDPATHGFDTIGEALSLSPEQMEVYLQTADKTLDQVFGSDREPKRVNVRKPMGQDEFATRSVPQLFVKTDDDSLVIFQEDWCPSVFNSGQATVDGTYRVRIHARTHQTDKPLVMAVYGGDVIVGRGRSHLVGYYDIAPGEKWTVIEFEDFLDAHGAYQMKPYNLHAPTQGPDRFKGPGLMIGEVEVVGPLEAWPAASRVRLMGDIDPAKGTVEDARAIVSRLLPRAFRRPVTAAEIDTYVSLIKSALDAGRSFIPALRLGLQAILCSPEFLFREEPVTGGEGQRPLALSAHALASRLSYFLWSSMPDEELLTRADTGRLGQPAVLHEQVERMLRDPKSARFVENFTGQWLGLREIDATEPDMRQYPEFDEMLRHAMVQETRRFFREILDNDLPLADFVDSDWAIINERLAKHYGIDGVTGQTYRRVALPAGSVRGGVLTQASILKVTANGTNTSPVVRGVWVLENILGRPTPPPPSGVAVIEPDIRGATTIRQQLQQHRNDSSCNVCHQHIDPPGFALESFDPIGGWRDWHRSLGEGARVDLEINRRRVQYRKGPAVDPSGQLADGRTFADIRAFKKLLASDSRPFARCLAGKLLVYATGRGLGFSDRPDIDSLVNSISDRNQGFRSLIHAVVQSRTFATK